MCRENYKGCHRFGSLQGSPPRVRGKRPQTARMLSGQGISPRVCGENILSTNLLRRGKGSPPRVRGKLSGYKTAGVGAGITPACVGKTRLEFMTGFRRRDHPRVCGENKRCSSSPERMKGSPPRVRGKRRWLVDQGKPARITPARAGKTPEPDTRQPSRWDHPRACGENYKVAFFSFPPRGSPPRVRGKLLICPSGSLAVRITPARAGKTALLSRMACTTRDHPRACGENSRS